MAAKHPDCFVMFLDCCMFFNRLLCLFGLRQQKQTLDDADCLLLIRLLESKTSFGLGVLAAFVPFCNSIDTSFHSHIEHFLSVVRNFLTRLCAKEGSVLLLPRTYNPAGQVS